MWCCPSWVSNGIFFSHNWSSRSKASQSVLVGLLFLHPVPFDGQGQKICSTKKCADLFFLETSWQKSCLLYYLEWEKSKKPEIENCTLHRMPRTHAVRKREDKTLSSTLNLQQKQAWYGSELPQRSCVLGEKLWSGIVVPLFDQEKQTKKSFPKPESTLLEHAET